MTTPRLNAKKTVIGYCETLQGQYTGIGSLVGEIQLPESEAPTEKFRANDDVNPTVFVDDIEYSTVELTVAYKDFATWAILKALEGLRRFVKFTLENGDVFVYSCLFAGVSPATGAQNRAIVGKIKLAAEYLAWASDGT
jgi:hypothetical protein